MTTNLKIAFLSLCIYVFLCSYVHSLDQLISEKQTIFKDEVFETGFIDVSHGQMFYWLVDSRKDPETAPLIIWLTGGPGCSSEMAVLSENGPWWVRSDGTLDINQHSWSEVGNVLYVDQPLGTGFSKAGNFKNFAFNEKKIAEEFGVFLKGFFDKYPKYKNRDAYITGESYAGHYIPSIAQYIVSQNMPELSLKGIAIGNGWVDPYVQYPAYAEFGKANQLISKIHYELAVKGYATCDGLIKGGLWPVAMYECESVTAGILGKLNPYDIRLQCKVPPFCYDETDLTTFLNRKDVQRIIGVEGKWESCDMLVHTLLLGDWINEAIPHKVLQLLEAGMKVLVYNGDKDFICNWMGGLAWVNNVEWKNKERFAKMELREWPAMDPKPAGELKVLDNFAFMRVYNAGHMVPMDQPASALEMIRSFVDGSLYTETPPRPAINDGYDTQYYARE